MEQAKRVRLAMNDLVIDTLRPMSIALGLLILWTAWSDRAAYTGPYAMWPVWADVFVGGFLLLTGGLAWIKRPPESWANPWGMAVVVTVCFTSAMALLVGRVPGTVPNLALVALGAGLVFMSLPWLIAAEATVAVTWYGVLASVPVADAQQPGFILQVALIIGFTVGWARRRAYTQILEARDRAEAAHRRAARLNEELERFAQVVTHDLQTPLTALRLKARIARIAVERNQAERAEAALRDIDRIANQSGVFVLEMLDYARSGEHTLRKERVELDAVAADVADLVEAPMMAIGGRLVVSPLPVVHGDYVQLRQLILNLVSNSIRYRREGEPLVVRLRGHEDAGGAAVTVDDNGQGFTVEEAGRLFKPFEMGKRGTGHGLGLALCKRIVEAHDGQITAEGRVGEGATFTIELPHVVPLERETAVSHPT